MPKLRHVVVYSAFKAEHVFEVRARRIRRALAELQRLRERAPRDSPPQTRLTELVTKCLTRNKCARYFTCRAGQGRLEIHLNRDEYREQRRFDGVFVLETNHQSMSTEEVVASYRQLMEVERTFRVLKSVRRTNPSPQAEAILKALGSSSATPSSTSPTRQPLEAPLNSDVVTNPIQVDEVELG